MKRLLINPQWQGGGDMETMEGAAEILNRYLQLEPCLLVPVSRNKKEAARVEQGIRGRTALQRQMEAARNMLETHAPDRIFAVGGGCDADVPVIGYLLRRYRDDLAIVWMDAHGELNTPEESETALFYGMPLRAVMHPSAFGLMDNEVPADPARIVHVGGRDLDPAEREFLRHSAVQVLSVDRCRTDPQCLKKAVARTGARHVYVHLDLDVLDGEQFVHTPLPVPGGLTEAEVRTLLESVRPDLVGLGLYEYKPAGKTVGFVEEMIRFGLSL